MSDELHDHPAVRAWRQARPDGSPPRLVETVRKSRSRATFRLHHHDDDVPTIAKRRWQECLETERNLYHQVLPQVRIPSVDYLGFVDADEPDRAWLFIEDVGGESYRNDDPKHRVLAAHWLAKVHSFSIDASTRELLPDRGPNRYLSDVRSSCTEISSHLRCDHFSANDRRILLATLRALLELEKRWGTVEAWCDDMPRTLIHGDFVAKNCRVREDETGQLELVVFDWETAGWGLPAVDLATNVFCRGGGVGLDRAIYAEAMRDVWPALGQLELERAARIGDAHRVVAAIQWACESLVYPWVVQAEFQFYLPHVEQALQLIRGDSARRTGNGMAAA